MSEQPKFGEWRPIESAPRDGERIIGFDRGDHFICHWCDCSGASAVNPRYGWGTKYDHGCMAYDEEAPTHWMPLPEDPREEGE